MEPDTAATTCTELCAHGRTRAEGCKPCFWVGGQCRCQPASAAALPDLPAGVWRHYKGPLYLTLGYGHDADADVLGYASAPGSSYFTSFDGVRNVVVYVGLQLDGAHTGPRLAVRTAEWFRALVHVEDGSMCEHVGHGSTWCGAREEAVAPRFTYVGPEWTGGPDD